MPRDEPAWWYGERQQGIARALSPIAEVYGRVAVARYKLANPYRSKLPVICVGNFSAGGTGKTPAAVAIVERLKAMGEAPAILTRGYGGRARGPVWADPAIHTAADVGDEPLLLVEAAPVMVARDRKAGAMMIEARGSKASVIVMDDGLQNAGLVKDLTLALIDEQRGLGNGRVIPAGPLRAPLAFQVQHCDAIVLMQGAETGTTRNTDVEALIERMPGRVLTAKFQTAKDAAWLSGMRVIAFAGIGNPQRFFLALPLLGATVLSTVPFRDHEMMTQDMAVELLAKAEADGATLIATEKDWVRLPAGAGPLGELKRQTRVLYIQTAFEAASALRLDELLKEALKRGRQGP